MGKPVWQRARIIGGPCDPRCVGRELWVEIGPPRETTDTYDVIRGGCSNNPHMTLATHLRAGDVPVLTVAKYTELLARSPEDFAEHVEPISWEDWLAEGAASAASKH